jgi:heptosyltransferase I
VVRLSALGDVTLLVPTIRTLQQAFPEAAITWITSRPAYQLLEGIQGVEFIVIDKPRGLGDYLQLRQQLCERHFDVLLAMQASLRVNLMYPCIRAKVKIGFDRQRARDGQWLFTNRRIPFAEQHLLDSFIAFAREIGATEAVICWDLAIGEEQRQWAREQLGEGGPLLAVNPAASKAERNWPVARFAEVINEAVRRWGVRVVLTGGPAEEEREIGRQLIAQLETAAINLIGLTSPKQLAAVLEAADCLLAPDTGPAHIAVAMGTPVVGLYAVAPPQLSAPYLYPELVVDRFPQAVQEILGQDPANVKWGTRVHDPSAMSLISVEDVLDKISQVLDAPRA